MRALQVTAHGEPDQVLAVRDVDVPEPGPGEVLIRVAGAALNHNDLARCRGTLVSVAKDPPFTLGMDLCGVVVATGDGAEEWLGRRVVAVAKDALGGIAEYAVAPVGGVFDAPGTARRRPGRGLPPAVPHHPPGAVPSGSHCSTGETLLVTAAASGLGTAAVQLGRAAGARVIAAVGSADKADAVPRARCRRRRGARRHATWPTPCWT